MRSFGISFTIAKYQIWNAYERTFDIESLRQDESENPSADWQGRESFTTDYFPLRSTPVSRRGSFAGLVAAAQISGLISADTAATYLCASSFEFERSREAIAQLYPDL
jgi:hypothetical protein